MQYVREELNDVPFITQAFRALGANLEAGSSRAVYSIPVNLSLRNAVEAMLYAARAAAEAIDEEGLDGINPRRMPLDVRTDESPEQFELAALPGHIKANIGDSPIGYIRVEMTEAGPNESVGALDPTTQTHYSVPLS